jgi:methionyl aminopeptidase
MIKIKSEEEIELIRQSSLLVGKTLAEVAKHIKPGIKTITLDTIAEKFIRDNGALPGFKGMYGYKHTLCISVNSQVVHGIPSEYELKEGDVISVDCGVLKNGFYGDVAYTFPVGIIAPEVQKLLNVTKECLNFAIEKAIAGNRIGDIGSAVQEHAEKNGYGVVRELVGHGLGKNLHEEPEVPNYGRKGNGVKLIEGMVIAIEPMINMGTKNVKHEKDGWTITTADGKPSAHYEHDVVVRKGKAEVLSSYAEIEEVLKTINK